MILACQLYICRTRALARRLHNLTTTHTSVSIVVPWPAGRMPGSWVDVVWMSSPGRYDPFDILETSIWSPFNLLLSVVVKPHYLFIIWSLGNHFSCSPLSPLCPFYSASKWQFVPLWRWRRLLYQMVWPRERPSSVAASRGDRSSVWYCVPLPRLETN